MVPSNRPGFRWRRAVLLSLVLHALVALAVYFWPWRATVPATQPTAKAGTLSLEKPGKKHSGEEAADEGVYGPLETASFKAPLITPVLDSGPVQRTPEESALLGSAGPGKGQPAMGAKGAAGPGTTFFQVGTRAKRIVYVLDASSSMGRDGLWARASRELGRSLEHLSDDVSFQVVVYHSVARPLLSARAGWLHADEATRKQVARALADLVLEGKTNHAAALNLALAQRPDAIFFLTDADDLSDSVLRQVQDWNHGRAVIHTFELNRQERPRPGAPLQEMARRSGGEYRVVARED